MKTERRHLHEQKFGSIHAKKQNVNVFLQSEVTEENHRNLYWDEACSLFNVVLYHLEEQI